MRLEIVVGDCTRCAIAICIISGTTDEFEIHGQLRRSANYVA